MVRIPRIKDVMTAPPRTVGVDIELSIAKKQMQTGGFRHLPVLSGGRLVGIVSDRDIKVAECFSGSGELTVGEIMTPDPYVVDESEPLDGVLMTMAANKYGCALVRHAISGNVVGIFTDTDALRFYGELLRKLGQKQAA
jgi:acetoin utilization protein AcuB